MKIPKDKHNYLERHHSGENYVNYIGQITYSPQYKAMAIKQT